MGATKVTLPAAWFATGYLPPRCARHGEPATGTASRDATTAVAPWAYLLLLAGFLPFLVVVLAMQKKLTGSVTTCPRCAVARRSFRLVVAACWAAVVLLFLGAGLADWMVLVAFAAIPVALVVSFSGGPRVGAVLSPDQVWVELRRVSPAFAADVAHGVARSQVAAPPASFAPPASYAPPGSYPPPASSGPSASSAAATSILPGG